jgi:hypothetical protein
MIQKNLLLLFLLCLMFFINCPDDKKPTPPDEPIFENLTLVTIPGLNVVIDSPEDNSSVQRVNTVKGTVYSLPTEYVLRVFVNPLSVGRWYPQQPVIMLSDSTWSTTAWVGVESDTNQEFYIGVMAVTEAQRNIIDEDITGNTQYIVSGTVPAIITVKRY